MNLTKTIIKDNNGIEYTVVSKPTKIHTRKHIDSLYNSILKLKSELDNKNKQIEELQKSLFENLNINIEQNNELYNKSKVIELMAEFINKISTHNRCKNRCINYCCCDDNCVKNTIEYFENKAKEMK
jgi:predicted RNase H-like nuclease (RuvC/YqgF family)